MSVSSFHLSNGLKTLTVKCRLKIPKNASAILNIIFWTMASFLKLCLQYRRFPKNLSRFVNDE